MAIDPCGPEFVGFSGRYWPKGDVRVKGEIVGGSAFISMDTGRVGHHHSSGHDAVDYFRSPYAFGAKKSPARLGSFCLGAEHIFSAFTVFMGVCGS